MRSLWRTGDRRALAARLERLTPDRAPRWGRLTAPQMIAHLIDAARLGLGEVETPRRNRGWSHVLRFPPAKQLFVYLLPFPRHAPGPRALFATPPSDWTGDLATLQALMERLAAQAADWQGPLPSHPYFGRLSVRAWGVLGFKHTDHHLRQFGV